MVDDGSVPSGTAPSSSTSTLINTGTSIENTPTDGFTQPPSETPDVANATQGGNTSGYNVVVGARNNTVYIHGTTNQNQPGKTYRAKFALDAMKKIVNDKKSSSDTKSSQ